MTDPQHIAPPSGWRRRLALGFIYAWLVVQIGPALYRKFEFPSFRYRDSRFAWGMYSKPGSNLDLSLYRTKPGSDLQEPIPDIHKYVAGYRSPEPMNLWFARRADHEAMGHFAKLIRFIAAERDDGYTYVVAGHWKQKNDADIPEQWEIHAKGRD